MILEKLLSYSPGRGTGSNTVSLDDSLLPASVSRGASRLMETPMGRALVAVFPVIGLAALSPVLPVFKPYFTGGAGYIVLAVALALALISSRIPVSWSLAAILVLAPAEPPIRVSNSYYIAFGASVLAASTFMLVVVDVIARNAITRRNLIASPRTLWFLLFLAFAVILSGIAAIIIHDVDLTLDEPILIARLFKYGMIFSIGWYVAVNYGLKYVLYMLLAAITGIVLAGVIGFTYSAAPPGYQEWLIVTYHKAFAYPVEDPLIMQALVQRSIGTTGNPNFFGGLVGAGLLFIVSVFLFVRSSNRYLMVYVAAATLLLILNVLAASSRTSWVAVVAAIIGSLVLLAGYRAVRRVWRIPVSIPALLTLIFVLIPASFAIIYGFNISSRLTDTFDQSIDRMLATAAFREAGANDFSPGARLEQLREYSKKWLESPITGFGVTEGFDDTDPRITNESEYTIILVRFGLIGAIAYIGLFVSIGITGVRLYFSEDSTSVALGVALILLSMFCFAFAIGGPSIHEGRRMALLFATAGLGYGVLVRERRRMSQDAGQLQVDAPRAG